MLPGILRIAAATDLGFSIAGTTGWLHDVLPLGGSSGAQLGIVLGAGLVLHELGALVGAVRERMCKNRKRKERAAKRPRA